LGKKKKGKKIRGSEAKEVRGVPEETVVKKKTYKRGGSRSEVRGVDIGRGGRDQLTREGDAWGMASVIKRVPLRRSKESANIRGERDESYGRARSKGVAKTTEKNLIRGHCECKKSRLSKVRKRGKAVKGCGKRKTTGGEVRDGKILMA